MLFRSNQLHFNKFFKMRLRDPHPTPGIRGGSAAGGPAEVTPQTEDQGRRHCRLSPPNRPCSGRRSLGHSLWTQSPEPDDTSPPELPERAREDYLAKGHLRSEGWGSASFRDSREIASKPREGCQAAKTPRQRSALDLCLEELTVWEER